MHALWPILLSLNGCLFDMGAVPPPICLPLFLTCVLDFLPLQGLSFWLVLFSEVSLVDWTLSLREVFFRIVTR